MITEEIRAVLLAKADALLRRSAEDMATLLHPDFVYVNAGGYKLDKAQYIDYGCTSGRIVFRSQKVSELDVRRLGGVAVATMVLDDQFALEGRSPAIMRFTAASPVLDRCAPPMRYSMKASWQIGHQRFRLSIMTSA